MRPISSLISKSCMTYAHLRAKRSGKMVKTKSKNKALKAKAKAKAQAKSIAKAKAKWFDNWNVTLAQMGGRASPMVNRDAPLARGMLGTMHFSVQEVRKTKWGNSLVIAGSIPLDSNVVLNSSTVPGVWNLNLNPTLFGAAGSNWLSAISSLHRRFRFEKAEAYMITDSPASNQGQLRAVFSDDPYDVLVGSNGVVFGNMLRKFNVVFTDVWEQLTIDAGKRLDTSWKYTLRTAASDDRLESAGIFQLGALSVNVGTTVTYGLNFVIELAEPQITLVNPSIVAPDSSDEEEEKKEPCRIQAEHGPMGLVPVLDRSGAYVLESAFLPSPASSTSQPFLARAVGRG